MTLAIVGRPNAGKSSVFNALVERDRAIVTAAPGTTRDTVSERIALGGFRWSWSIRPACAKQPTRPSASALCAAAKLWPTQRLCSSSSTPQNRPEENCMKKIAR
jgi:hypothetical protein